MSSIGTIIDQAGHPAVVIGRRRAPEALRYMAIFLDRPMRFEFNLKPEGPRDLYAAANGWERAAEEHLAFARRAKLDRTKRIWLGLAWKCLSRRDRILRVARRSA